MKPEYIHMNRSPKILCVYVFVLYWDMKIRILKNEEEDKKSVKAQETPTVVLIIVVYMIISLWNIKEATRNGKRCF